MSIPSLRSVCVLVLLCVSSAVTAWPQTADSDAASKIAALEVAWDRALRQRDLRVIEQILDNNLIYIEYDGSLLSKSEVIARLKSPEAVPRELTMGPLTIRVFGSLAVAVASYQEKGIAQGKPYERHGRYVDTWAFRDGRWVCVVAQATLLQH